MSSMISKKEHEALLWARDVVAGKVIVCKWVKLACERHFSDLTNAIEKGIYFDDTAALRVIRFIEKLKHTKGEWAGKNFMLEPWQKFIIWQIFGWKRADGTRRFRYAYVDVARKNGKTVLSAGVGLYMLFADGEARAEVYSAATTRDQAKICFNDAVAIVQSTALKNRLKVWTNSITYQATGGTFKPLSSEYKTGDGYNPSCAIVDEFHAHATGGMFDVLKSGMGARRQPLMFIITTAGENKSGVCFAYRTNVMQVIEGVNQDDSLFGIIFTLDEPDKWDDPEHWQLSNPNLGVSVSRKYLEEQVLDAKNRPNAVFNVMTKNLNLWVDAAKTWILDDRWMACTGVQRDLSGCTAWAGLDLSNVSDITALVLIFNEDNRYQLIPFFWIPEDKMREKVNKENINFDGWVRDGYVHMTPGNSIDYDFIRAQMNLIYTKYDVQSTSYDRWNSTQFVHNLTSDGYVMSPMGQGYASLSAPTKEFEVLVLGEKVEHFANPVLRWMINSTAIVSDPAGNIKVDKQKSSQKIDGVAASIMALGELITAMAKENSNPYATRGLRTLG